MVIVDETVVRGVGFTEHREAPRMLGPRKVAAIDNDAAERRTVSAQEFCQGMHNNVSAVFERPQQNGSRNRIVYQQRNAGLMGNVRERFEVADVSCRVPDAFAENHARVAINHLCNA